MHEQRERLIKDIWTPPASWKMPGTWFWWFWLFFIHDDETKKTGRCRQLMILWSIKKDKQIMCNSLDIRIPDQLRVEGEGRWALDGAAAAWYFDGDKMHDDYVLEKSCMSLDREGMALKAPGKTPSSFYMDGEDFVTKIDTGSGASAHRFEFRAKQTDLHPAVGPVHGKTELPLGMGVEGTMIERMDLSGTERIGKKSRKISGTAYFQKILVAVPPPQWYWGIYHFKGGSFLTFMVSYAGRAMLADNLLGQVRLKKPTVTVKQDITLYHAPSGRVFKADNVSLKPKHEGGHLWSHEINARGKEPGKEFEICALAKAYAHSCWKFVKDIGPIPAKSTFKYNEYPAVLERLEFKAKNGERIVLENGWGNMENSWGFII
jgi:hypothetical protein